MVDLISLEPSQRAGAQFSVPPLIRRASAPFVMTETWCWASVGERLAYHYTNEENGLVLRRYWTNACQNCAIKHNCTTSKERRITRWEHEHVLEAVQKPT